MSVKGDESMMAAARYSLGSAPLIVFVIGGGVYSEYHNLLAFAKVRGAASPLIKLAKIILLRASLILNRHMYA